MSKKSCLYRWRGPVALSLAVWGLFGVCMAAEPGVSVLAKAQPDEFFNGVGQPYYALGDQPPGEVGQPKVNQAYVWSLVQTGNGVWFGTAANPVAAALGGITGVPIPWEATHNVFEFRKSQYPGVPWALKLFLGDWRPPEIHRYDSQLGLVNMTPNDPLVASTLGFRSAGFGNGVVLMGGPDLSQIGINLFAFDADTGDFLGSTKLLQYADIRRWVNVNGVLYTATLNTWTTQGAGSVLRWRGSKAAPFVFDVVGELDNEGAALCAHQGRLFAFTWSTLSQTIETITGARSQQPSGVWMSPPLPPGGLSVAHRRAWSKVWSVDRYEPDPVIVRSLWMGACASHDGHLVWGTIQVPGYGAQVLKEVYGWPPTAAEILPAIRQSFRPAALFRGRLDSRGGFQAELLYGDAELPTYSEAGGVGTWTPTPNGMGPAKLGPAGFGDPFNMYVWSMQPHQNRLWIGTFDMSFIFFGEQYATGGRIPPNIGADLLVLDRTDEPASFVSRTGVGNIANNGIRDMASDGTTLLLGTATSANLLTDPHDGLVEGGWELLRFDPAAAGATTRTPRSSAKLPDGDWSRVIRPLGQTPP
jgi:hypothetical protein